MPPISKWLEPIRRYEDWMMDLPGLVAIPLAMLTFAIPILLVTAIIVAVISGLEQREMAKLHCRASGKSRAYHHSAHQVLVGKTMMMIPASDGTEYEYSCDDGYRWR